MTDNLLLHYDNITEFKRVYQEHLLTVSNMIDGEKFIKKLTDTDGEEWEYNKFCYVLEKGGKKYLLEDRYKNDLPIVVTRSEKFSLRGDAYYLIRNYSSAKFVPQKKMSFREMVDKLSTFDSSSPDQRKLMWIISLGQMMTRINYRVSTPPAFGKDSVVDICGHLFGHAATIENPTRAKLEYMTVARLLAVNEVVDITSDKWRDVEQFLLQVGAMKPSVTKSSRSLSGSSGETLDLTSFSISLMYNDIDRYPKKKKYFDKVCSDQLKDRFFPLRFFGTLKEDFNRIRGVDVESFVREHKTEYEDLIRTFRYYEEHGATEIKKFQTTKWAVDIANLRDRWRNNVGKIMMFVDLYSETQEEFDKWLGVLFDAHRDYLTMLEYPVLDEQVSKRMGILTAEKQVEFRKAIEKEETFIGKKRVINQFLANKRQKREDFW